MINKALQEYLTPGSRQKIYLILVFVSLILLFYSIWQIKPVVVERGDPVGLVSHLTLFYWIGLALLVLDSILAFLDQELKKNGLFLLILIVLGLFLVGIPAFAYENVREPSVYYMPSETELILAEGHLDVDEPVSIAAYYPWPAYYFIHASVVTITNIGFAIVRYGPLFFILWLVFITYGIGKRLNMTPGYCFALSFLTLSSWLYYFDYHPRTLSTMMFLSILLLLLDPRKRPAMSVAVILLFSALVLTHGFTVLAILPAILLLSIYRKEPALIILLAVIFGAWYMYRVAVMQEGIRALSRPLWDIFQLARLETYQVGASTARSIARNSQLGYLASYFVLTVGSAILLLRRRIIEPHRKQVIVLFCWAIGTALTVVLFYGGEGPYRLYVLSLVPAIGIIILSWANRKRVTILMVALMSLFVALFLPANYAQDASWAQVLTQDLKGSEFVAVKVNPVYKTFVGPQGELFFRYNPYLFHGVFQYYYFANFVTKSGEIDSSKLARVDYAAIGKYASSGHMLIYGKDIFTDWFQTGDGKTADLLYTNGDFQVYQNYYAGK